eukprot:586672-Amphidinium_carterae.1
MASTAASPCKQIKVPLSQSILPRQRRPIPQSDLLVNACNGEHVQGVHLARGGVRGGSQILQLLQFGQGSSANAVGKAAGLLLKARE